MWCNNAAASEKEEKTKESLEKAKEAVALDVKDGTSWSKLMCAWLLDKRR